MVINAAEILGKLKPYSVLPTVDANGKPMEYKLPSGYTREGTVLVHYESFIPDDCGCGQLTLHGVEREMELVESFIILRQHIAIQNALSVLHVQYTKPSLKTFYRRFIPAARFDITMEKGEIIELIPQIDQKAQFILDHGC